MNVFDIAVNWLCVYLVISCLALILAVFFRHVLTPFFRHVLFFFLGAAFLLFIYYSFYLIPLYLISIPTAVALGISLHSYTPLFLAIITDAFLAKILRQHKQIKYSFLLGLLVPLIFGIAFLIKWNSINNQIDIAINRNTLNEGKLPAWAVISQTIPKNFIAERIIKADLVYKTINDKNWWWWEGTANMRFNETMKHDPLVVIAGLIHKKPNLDDRERIKILEAMYDSRHQAQEQLWSGDKLETSNIISNVKVFPEYRMAYTEKILSIRNNDNQRWSINQEAIYTFHLPEGSVVSSLSLWIGGKEEKARLTTKAKADSAYKQIVGVENRDPSVIHWQEGNTVSVRVFPCTPSESRKFKIGISSPLRKEGGQLIYENIYFDGPGGNNATETVQLAFSQKPQHYQAPAGYEEIKQNTYQLNRNYQPYWEISCKAPALSKTSFSFNNYTYQLKDYAVNYEPFDAQTVYLDLNSSWTKQEFLEVWDNIKTKRVYAFDSEMTQLNQENRDAIFSRMNKLNFSLFPVYKIKDPEKSLIISKSAEASPNLGDLQESEFANRLTAYLNQPKTIRLYNIGHQISPYLKALKEFRVFSYHSGSSTALADLLKQKKFIRQQENASTVVIGHAALMIEEKQGISTGNAPDHLLRLFAYNDIMKKVAGNYFSNDFIQPDVLAEADKAYIVSPVSSLIVLETKQDYDRFGIDESKNSLENASMKSSGAVPEPHEWLMILLTAGVVIYLMYKPKFTKQVA